MLCDHDSNKRLQAIQCQGQDAQPFTAGPRHIGCADVAASCRTNVLLAKYAALREVRAGVSKQLEEVRIAGGIGSSLQAEVTIHAAGARHTSSRGSGLRR